MNLSGAIYILKSNVDTGFTRIRVGLRAAGRHWAVWLFVVAFVGVVGWKVGVAGLRIRNQVWAESRSLRFHWDIANAFRWGSEVVSTARETAVDPANVTFWEIVRAEGTVYRRLVSGPENFELDYPPGRLLVMSLWQRHVDRQFPKLASWPGRTFWGSSRRDSSASITEEIAAPLLTVNTAMEAATALLAAALVGLWVGRSAHHERRSLTADGVLAYMISAAGLFYAFTVAVSPCPSPPPTVSIAGPPAISETGGRTGSATVYATINCAGGTTEWHVKWGTEAGQYTHSTPPQRLTGSTAIDVAAELKDLSVKSTVHYCIEARNNFVRQNSDIDARGTTRTDDAMLVVDNVVQPPQPTEVYGAVWLSSSHWIGMGVLFIAMCWAMRQMDARHRAWAAALLAGVLVWLNPALLVNTHVWPQWDVWLLPPYLLAALLVSLDCWLMAGMVIGVGMLFKGQFLIGAPLLLIWPIAGGNWRGALRLVIGAALMSGVLLSPFIALAGRTPSDYPAPLRWIGSVFVAAGIGVCLSLARRPAMRWAGLAWNGRRWLRRGDQRQAVAASSEPRSWSFIVIKSSIVLFALIAATLFVLQPWPATANISRWWGVALLAALLVVPWLLSRKSLLVWTATVAAVAIWMCSPLFHGDWSWMTVGYEYGASKFDVAATGAGSNGNLGLILSQRFGWNLHDPAMTIRLPNVMSYFYGGSSSADAPQWLHAASIDGTPLTFDLKQTTIAIFAVLMIAVGIGAAGHARRGDPRVLAAIVAPWALMPNILCQMMTRYHLWGAVLTAMLVGIAAELTVLSVVVTLLAAGMVGNQLLQRDPGRSPQLHAFFSGLSPDGGWLMLAGAAIVVYLAVVPIRRQDSD